VAEGGGLLNRYTGKTVSEVRILSSPPVLKFNIKLNINIHDLACFCP
jgi:hypothetical protein